MPPSEPDVQDFQVSGSPEFDFPPQRYRWFVISFRFLPSSLPLQVARATFLIRKRQPPGALRPVTSFPGF